MKENQLSALIDLAIAREENAIAFYTGLRDRVAFSSRAMATSREVRP